VLTIYVRNALINLLLLLPLTIILVLLGRSIVLFYAMFGAPQGLRTTVFATFCGLLSLAIFSLGHQLAYLRSPAARPHGRMRVALNWTILLPLVASAALACWTFSIEPRRSATDVGGGGLDEGSFLIRLPGAAPVVAGALPGLTEPGLRGWGDRVANRLHDVERWLLDQIQGLQPNSDNSPFGIFDYASNTWFYQHFPVFNWIGLDLKAHVFDDWYNRGSLLLVPAIEYGLVFGGLALLVHVIGFIVLSLSGLDHDSLARRYRNRVRVSMRMVSLSTT
jgi:hypothetical protein